MLVQFCLPLLLAALSVRAVVQSTTLSFASSDARRPISITSLSVSTSSFDVDRCTLRPVSTTRNDVQTTSNNSAGGIFTSIGATRPSDATNFHTAVIGDTDVCSGFSRINANTVMTFRFARPLVASDLVVFADMRGDGDPAGSSDPFRVQLVEPGAGGATELLASPVSVLTSDYGVAGAVVCTVTNGLVEGNVSAPRAVAIPFSDLAPNGLARPTSSLVVSNATGWDLVAVFLVDSNCVRASTMAPSTTPTTTRTTLTTTSTTINLPPTTTTTTSTTSTTTDTSSTTEAIDQAKTTSTSTSSSKTQTTTTITTTMGALINTDRTLPNNDIAVIGGAVGGGVAGLLILILLVVCAFKARKRRLAQSLSPTPSAAIVRSYSADQGISATTSTEYAAAPTPNDDEEQIPEVPVRPNPNGYGPAPRTSDIAPKISRAPTPKLGQAGIFYDRVPTSPEMFTPRSPRDKDYVSLRLKEQDTPEYVEVPPLENAV